MIDTPTFTTRPAHPVRWFVGAISGVAAMLLVLWWSGLANPRLEVEAANPEALGGQVTVDITNNGPFPASVVGTVPLQGDGGSVPLAAPVDVPGGGQAEATVPASADCGYHTLKILVRLEVRTAIGIHRSVDVPRPPSGACSF